MPNQRNYASRRTRRRRQRYKDRPSSGLLGRVLIMLAIVAAIVLGVAIFFRVNIVDVQGNVIYSADQVREASGVEVGDNLLTVNRAAINGNIQARMPYVQDVSVGLILPDTVVIQVKESEIAGLVQSDTGGNWYVNTEGRVLGSSVEDFQGQIVELKGFTITAPQAGAAAVASEGQEESLSASLEVIRQMEGTGLIEQITAIDAAKSYDLLLYSGDRLEIMLGGTEQLDYKIQYLQVVLDGLEDYQTGIIDLTFDVEQVARFIPTTQTTGDAAAQPDPSTDSGDTAAQPDSSTGSGDTTGQ